MNDRLKREQLEAGRCTKGLCSDLSKSWEACCGLRRGVTLRLKSPQPHRERKRKKLVTGASFRIRWSPQNPTVPAHQTREKWRALWVLCRGWLTAEWQETAGISAGNTLVSAGMAPHFRRDSS